MNIYKTKVQENNYAEKQIQKPQKEENAKNILFIHNYINNDYSVAHD